MNVTEAAPVYSPAAVFPDSFPDSISAAAQVTPKPCKAVGGFFCGCKAACFFPETTGKVNAANSFSLTALCEAAATADCAPSFMFDRSAAFGTLSYAHYLAMAVIAVAISFFALLEIFFQGLCDCVRAGGNLASVRPCLLMACDALELADYCLRFYV